MSAEEERAAIVAWLREQDKLEGISYSDYAWAADAIERSDHLQQSPPIVEPETQKDVE